MYPELVKYKELKQQYEEQLNRLKIEQEDLEEDKEQMLDRYEELLGKVGSKNNSDPSNSENLTNVRSDLQGLTEELGDLLEESAHLSRAQRDRLNEWMLPLQKGLDREVQAAKQHMKIKKDEFRTYRIEMMLLLQQVYEIEDYIQEIHLSYSDACQEYLSNQDKQTLQLQAIEIRKDAKQMLDELQEDLDYVRENGKMPKWFHERVNSKG